MDLRMRAIVAYASVCGKLDTANQELWKFIGRSSPIYSSNLIRRLQDHSRGFTSLPFYNRRLYGEQLEFWRFEVSGLLKPVMYNNLVLDNSQDGPGQGRFKDYFLCAEVTDKELPWDENEVDW